MRASAVVALMAAACLCAAPAAAQLTTDAPSTGLEALNGFIRVSGTDFVDDDCNQFIFSGYNTWMPLEQAAGICCGGAKGLGDQLDSAVANNLTVIRAFAFLVQQGQNLQLGDGTYNETYLVAMDEFVAAASARGLKLIMALANNWAYNSNMTDTKCWYAEQAGLDECDEFWTSPDAMQAYKDHVRFIMRRRNSVTGVTYGNDPTIFAWNLINEGRCESANCTNGDIQAWTAEVAPYVKALTGSLVTVGQEGYFGVGNCVSDYANPVDNADGWPLATGQDFMPNHAVDGVDFTSVHMWSDNWGRTDVPFAQGWLEAHMQAAALLGKPLVLEEFGKASGPFETNGNVYGAGTTAADQTAYYKLVYSYAETSINTGNTLKGVAFWRWDAIDSGSTLSALDSALTLNSTSAAFNDVIVPFSQRMKERSLAKRGVPGCSRVTAPAVAGGATPTSPATTNAGRRLLAAPAPAPALSAAAINAEFTNCTAFEAYSLQAQSQD